MKVKSGSVLVAKHPPYGYDVEAADDGRKFRLVLNLSEARVVELVYKLFLYGSGDNSTYAGKWTHGKTIRGKDNPSDKHVQVQVPSIVSQEVWERAQARLAKNSIMAQRKAVHEYLLRRRVQCEICGRFMQAENQWD